MRTLATITALLVGGCGAMSELYPASVQPLGPDTFAVSAQLDRRDFSSGLPGAQRKALEAARETCERQGKKLLVNGTESGTQGVHVFYNANFRCLAPNDPELTRPNYTPTPSVVIEDRRR
jgi:hypothetical protein